VAIGTALVGTPLWVALDEFVLHWTDWLPTWAPLISNGVIPLAVVLLALLALDEWATRSFRADLEERVLFMATMLFTAFVVLTIIGIYFRGFGMSLQWPWIVAASLH
jgi:hypothetical protein